MKIVDTDGMKPFKQFLSLQGLALIGLLFALPLQAQPVRDAGAEGSVIFDQVRVFDGQSSSLSAPTRVLIRGNRIIAIGQDIELDPAAQVITAPEHTLMPGLI